VTNPLLSEDTQATLRTALAFGAKVTEKANCWIIQGADPLHGAKKPVEIEESGATLRFMIPVAALAAEPSEFVLGAGLAKRPIEPLLEAMRRLGAETHVAMDGRNVIRVEGGGIAGGKTSIPGDVSSQFVSGLMFACPLARSETEITITSPLESKSYVRMTQDVLNKHGINVDVSEDFGTVKINSGQQYKPIDLCVPGDFSSAAFLLSAAAITKSEVTVKNLDYTTKQGDKQILGLLKKMGVEGSVCPDSVKIDGSDEFLNSIDVDVREIPDLVPVCAVLACLANGTSVIHDAQRLRLKESDRLASLFSELQKMGANIVMKDGSLTIKGPCRLHGTVIDPHNDHRIAMACAVAALRAEGGTVIQNSECVRKSYPLFFHDLERLGANVIGGQFDR
ncbi:MAG TPA: 3-phosphoshikimate 1-carboxyvinyltransferase, partial [Candidatus Nanoarchaeia archaeon]|nr:3-phosphoshikimate 1-carboxyvinyltransferase [Candidatus Nanoarchaeia archaeon]